MNRRNGTGVEVGKKNGYAVGCAGRDGETLTAGDERIPFGVSDRGSRIRSRDFANECSMNLTLLEQSFGLDAQALRETRSVLSHCIVVVAEVESQVERVVRRLAHAPRASREDVHESVPIQKGGMERSHIVCCSTASLRERSWRAKRGVPQARAGSFLVHRFPSVEWTNALRVALNNCRAYREVGKPWTFGAVAMIVQRDADDDHSCGAGIVLDVHRGECRSARFVEGECDPQDAEFVIVGSYARWRDVIEGRLDPIKGMMEGKLKLARGHLPTIIRFVEPTRLVVASASKVPTQFAD
jgi:putative sterol carrier protein